MMTALIKMEQIEKGCVTMELYNYLPQQAFVLTTAFHQDRKIGRWREEQRRGNRKRGEETGGDKRKFLMATKVEWNL